VCCQVMSSSRSLAALSFLLRAKSKQTVVRLFNRAFMYRNSKLDEVPRSAMANDLTISEEEAERLLLAMIEIVQTMLYTSSVADAMQKIDDDPTDVDARLRGLIQQILQAQLPTWRDASIIQRPSLPRLVDVDWRVDVKAASDQVANMSVPSVLMNIKVQGQPTHTTQVPQCQNIDFELSKEALSTMLDGLGKIRDQLSAVAAKK